MGWIEVSSINMLVVILFINCIVVISLSMLSSVHRTKRLNIMSNKPLHRIDLNLLVIFQNSFTGALMAVSPGLLIGYPFLLLL